MQEQQIVAALIPMIERVVQLNAAYPLSLECNLFEVGLDSLGVMELIVEIENHFQVTFGDEELAPELFERLGTLVTLIGQKMSTTTLRQEIGAA